MNGNLRTVVTGTAIVLVLVGLYFAGHILVPFLMAGVIAYVLDPAVGMLERRAGMRRPVAILVVMGVVALLLVGVVALAVPEMISQARTFNERLPTYGAQIREKFLPFTQWLEERYPGYTEQVRQRAIEGAQEVLPTVGGWLATGVLGLIKSLVRVVVWALTIVIIPVFAFYLLADYADLRDAFMALVPIHRRQGVRRIAGEINNVLRAWVKGQLTVSLALAVIYSIGLTILGVPLGLLIGVVGGLANMVPYLGLVVGFFPAALLSVLETGGWLQPLLVAGVFILGQVLEGTVISPRVMGSGLGLPPALILLAVLVGGELFGFTGLLLAVPTTAAAFVLLKDLRRQYDEANLEMNRPVTAHARPVRRRRPR